MSYRTALSSLSSLSLRTSGSLLYRVYVAPSWVIAAVGFVLLFLFALASYLDGRGMLTPGVGVWWRNLQFPALSIYILIIGHFLNRHEIEVVNSFRPYVAIDDAAMDRLLARVSGSRRGDLIVLGVGIALGIIMNPTWNLESEGFWTQVFVRGTILLLYMLVTLSVYRIGESSRLFRALYKEPLKLDIFDLSPLRPVAQHSLAIASTFMGAITLSVLFNPYAEWLLSFPALLIYGISALIAVVLFFSNLLDAHHVMLRIKMNELKVVRDHLSMNYYALKDRTPAGQLPGAGSLEGPTTLWLAYEKRIKEAPEWPFTGGTLRDLAASIILPVVVGVVANFLTK